MTGFNIPLNWCDVKRLAPYYMKLVGMVLIVGGVTFAASGGDIALALMAAGSSLMLEHYFTYGGFDLLDFAGHETYGLIMIIIGILLATKWEQWRTLDLKHPRNWIR